MLGKTAVFDIGMDCPEARRGVGLSCAEKARRQE
jgi:hypothetical protein